MSQSYRKLLYRLKLDRFGGYYALALIASVIILGLIFRKQLNVSNWFQRDSVVESTDDENPVPNRTGSSLVETTQTLDPDLSDKISSADISILFIGNEHTHRHDVPALIQTMLLSTQPDKKIFVASSTKGGMELSAHAQRELTQKMLAAGNWDYVVVQGYRNQQTTIGINRIRQMDELKDAQLVLFPLWAVKSFPRQALTIHRNHIASAKKFKADVAPVGIAWMHTFRQERNSDIYYINSDHANFSGAYLTACVFYWYFAGPTAKDLELFELDPAQDKLIVPEFREKIHQIAKTANKANAFRYTKWREKNPN